MTIDYVADANGVVMKAGIVLMTENSLQHARNVGFGTQQVIEQERTVMIIDQRSINHVNGAEETENRVYQLIFPNEIVSKQQIADRGIEELNDVWGNDTRSHGLTFDEANREKLSVDTALSNDKLENISNQTQEYIAMSRSSDIIRNPSFLMKSLVALDNADTNLDAIVLRNEYQESQICITGLINDGEPNETTKSDITSWDEKYHDMFTAILEKSRLKAEKEATRRAIEAVSNGWDCTCFEDLISKSLADYVTLYQKACELRYNSDLYPA